MTMLLEQLIDAMDAADEHNASKRALVEIVLRQGCLVARAIAIAIDHDNRVAIIPNRIERTISLDLLEELRFLGAARQTVDEAVQAL